MTDRWNLIEGDALDVLPSLPVGSVDAVICDPPYSSGGMFRGDRTATGKQYAGISVDFAGDSRDQRSWTWWCLIWLRMALRATRDGGVLAVFTDWRQLPALTDAVQASGWNWRGVLSWCKPVSFPQPARPSQSCEYVVWASRGALSFTRDAPVIPGFIVEPYVPSSVRRHATEKPVAVMRWLAQVCEAGGLVLDPFAGSGSTGVGALVEGRRFLGVEISPEYAAIARERCRRAADGLVQPIGRNGGAQMLLAMPQAEDGGP